MGSSSDITKAIACIRADGRQLTDISRSIGLRSNYASDAVCHRRPAPLAKLGDAVDYPPGLADALRALSRSRKAASQQIARDAYRDMRGAELRMRTLRDSICRRLFPVPWGPPQPPLLT